MLFRSAANSVLRGTLIAVKVYNQKEDLEAAMWVAQLCPEHTVTQKDEIVGMSLTSQVPQGAVLSHRYFEAEKPQIEIPSGHVAFCLPITDRNNFPQNLVSGQNIAAYEMEDGAMRLVSSNIKVLDAENLGVKIGRAHV